MPAKPANNVLLLLLTALCLALALPARAQQPGPKTPAQATASAPGPSAGYDGWVEIFYQNLDTDTNKGLSYLAASFVVPEAPAAGSADTQNIVFANAQASASDDYAGIKTAIAWNGDAGTGPGWSMASWGCCTDGQLRHSDAVPVAPGDIIQGIMQGSQCDVDTGICAHWSITTKNRTSGASTTLEMNDYQHALDVVIPGAMEAYGIDGCDKLPASGSVDFTDVSTRNAAGDDITLDYLAVVYPSFDSVQCHYAVEPLLAHKAFRLHFQPPPARVRGVPGPRRPHRSR